MGCCGGRDQLLATDSFGELEYLFEGATFRLNQRDEIWFLACDEVVIQQGDES
jgi:hypothetical protein